MELEDRVEDVVRVKEELWLATRDQWSECRSLSLVRGPDGRPVSPRQRLCPHNQGSVEGCSMCGVMTNMILLHIKKGEGMEKRRRKSNDSTSSSGGDDHLLSDRDDMDRLADQSEELRRRSLRRNASSHIDGNLDKAIGTTNQLAAGSMNSSLSRSPSSSPISHSKDYVYIQSRRSSASSSQHLKPPSIDLSTTSRSPTRSGDGSSIHDLSSIHQSNSLSTSPIASEVSSQMGSGRDITTMRCDMTGYGRIEEGEEYVQKEWPQDWLRNTPLMMHDTPCFVPEVLAGEQDPKYVEAFMREYALSFALQYRKSLHKIKERSREEGEEAVVVVVDDQCTVSELDLLLWAVFQHQARHGRKGSPLHASQHAVYKIR